MTTPLMLWREPRGQDTRAQSPPEVGPSVLGGYQLVVRQPLLPCLCVLGGGSHVQGAWGVIYDNTVALDEPRPWRGRGHASISCAEVGAPRQPLQELQRREDPIPHAVVSSRLQLERDAAVAPPPQTLLGERRAQYISARVPARSFADCPTSACRTGRRMKRQRAPTTYGEEAPTATVCPMSTEGSR
jgi:hypothetical protein